MKKIEAEIVAPQKVNIIMEYVNNILENSNKVSAQMNFDSVKIDGQCMCVLDINMVNHEQHLNLGIPSQFADIIFKELLNRVLNDVLPSESMGATKFYRFRSNDNSFDGINIMNEIGSEIRLNMYGINKSISDEYNQKYEEYRNSLKNKIR